MHGEVPPVERGDEPAHEPRLALPFAFFFAGLLQWYADERELLLHVLVMVHAVLPLAEPRAAHAGHGLVDVRERACEQVEGTVLAFQQTPVSHAGHADLCGEPVEERAELLGFLCPVRITRPIQEGRAGWDARPKPYSAGRVH